MIFTPLSSSSAGNLYLLEDGEGHRLAIECGIRYAEMQQRLDYRIGELDGVLLSHSHGDHSRAAKRVLQGGVDIYALSDTFRALKLCGHHNAQAIEPHHAFTVKGRWRVLPFDLRHDIPALGFVVLCRDNDKLLYVTDTAYVPYRFKGLTLIAVETNYSEAILRASEEDATRKMRSLRYHLSLERVLKFLTLNDLREVRAIHLLHLSDSHSDADLFGRCVQEATGKPVYVAGKT